MSFKFLSGPTLLDLAILLCLAPIFQLLSRCEPDEPASSDLSSGPPPEDSLPVSWYVWRKPFKLLSAIMLPLWVVVVLLVVIVPVGLIVAGVVGQLVANLVGVADRPASFLADAVD